MKILALDLASTTGWAITPQESGTWDIRPGRGESPGMRYVRLRAHLERVRAAHPDLGLVVYELQHHRGGAATEYAVGCATTVQAWCAERGLLHAAVHTATLKRHALGPAPKRRRGEPRFDRSKGAIVAAAERRWPAVRIVDDNHADALHLLDLAIETFAPVGAGEAR